ncbi:MAG: Sec-independent protein translocase protein TatB [Pseudomonadota bacterium]
MFDLGALELIVIGIVALIVVGPKDLPGMFRTVGRFMGKARGMAREFQRSMEEAADDTGLNEATKGLRNINGGLGSVRKTAQTYAKSMLDDDPTPSKSGVAKTGEAAKDAPAPADMTPKPPTGDAAASAPTAPQTPTGKGADTTPANTTPAAAPDSTVEPGAKDAARHG